MADEHFEAAPLLSRTPAKDPILEVVEQLTDLCTFDREQCPNALGFFPVDDPAALADLIADRWPSLPARPNPEREKEALSAEAAFALNYGRQLLEICTEVL